MTTLSKVISLAQEVYRFPVNFFRLLISLDQAMAEGRRRKCENFNNFF